METINFDRLMASHALFGWQTQPKHVWAMKKLDYDMDLSEYIC